MSASTLQALPLEIKKVVEELMATDARIEAKTDNNTTAIEQLSKDMAQIRLLLANVATKDDVTVILRDALNSTPATQTMLWSAALVAITAMAIFFHH